MKTVYVIKDNPFRTFKDADDALEHDIQEHPELHRTYNKSLKRCLNMIIEVNQEQLCQLQSNYERG